MNEENALLYPLAGLFSIVLSIPLLLFWKRQGWARVTVMFALLAAIVGSWWLFDLSKSGVNMQATMFAITLLPPIVALLVAGLIELKLKVDHRRQRHHRRRRKSRGASTTAAQ